MSASSTGTIQSPGYPGNYPNYTRCIWIFEAPDYYVTQLTVTFQGEMYNSACSDYVEVTEFPFNFNNNITASSTTTRMTTTIATRISSSKQQPEKRQKERNRKKKKNITKTA